MAWRKAAGDNAPRGCKDLREVTGLPVVTLPGKAGDLVIWNSLLPHGNARNTSDSARQAMFLTMTPVDELVTAADGDADAVRESRIQAWMERAGDTLANFEGQEPAALTPLGEKLLGSRPW